MQKTDTTNSTTPELNGPGEEPRRTLSAQLQRLAIATAILGLCFSRQLWDWAHYGLHNDLFSYILLIPFVSIYIAWTEKEKLVVTMPAVGFAAALSGSAMLLLGLYWFFLKPRFVLSESDRLCVLIGSFVLLFLAACALFLGGRAMRSAAFAAAFLFLMVPLPSVAEHAIEGFLQHRSADAAYLLIKMSGMPILREGTLFMLPGLRLEVAPECSGIRSTLVLLLTSLVASHFFLQKPLNKLILVGSIVFLGILRNAFRIFTLAQLTVNVDSTIIDSALHRRGGSLFFGLFLIPFFGLLWFLRRTERFKKQTIRSKS